MQLSDLKQIETGHYVLYTVEHTNAIAAFSDSELAKDVGMVLQSYCNFFWEDRPGAFLGIHKRIYVFDGEHFHPIGHNMSWTMNLLSRYDNLRQLNRSGPEYFETEFARVVLRMFRCPVLRRRSFFMDKLCCYTCCCCCFGRYVKARCNLVISK